MARKKISPFFIKNLQLLENQVFGSEKKFAKAINKSPQAFNHYTQGNTMPTLETLILIEELTGIPIKRLLTEDLSGSEYFNRNTKTLDNTIVREEPDAIYQRQKQPDELSRLQNLVSNLSESLSNVSKLVNEVPALRMKIEALERELKELNNKK